MNVHDLTFVPGTGPVVGDTASSSGRSPAPACGGEGPSLFGLVTSTGHADEMDTWAEHLDEVAGALLTCGQNAARSGPTRTTRTRPWRGQPCDLGKCESHLPESNRRPIHY